VAGVILAIAFLLIVSYHYSYVELVPEYTGVNFKEVQIGSLSIELPDSFSLNPNTSRVTITYPNFSFDLHETIYQKTDTVNDAKLLESRCFGQNYRNYNEFNHEKDSEFSSLSQYPTVIISPKDTVIENVEIRSKSERYVAAFFLGNGCAWIIANIEEDIYPATKMEIFKQITRDFLGYYQFSVNGGVGESFRTLLGSIMFNNKFKISADFRFLASGTDINQTIHYFISFINPKTNWPENVHTRHVSYIDRLIFYATARFDAKNIMGYRWTYKQDDFQLSKFYSGKELIIMRNSLDAHPLELEMIAYAKRISDSGNSPDYILINMTADGDTLFTTPNYNVVYGYWVRAKESARII
jgi:hypothetical protein